MTDTARPRQNQREHILDTALLLMSEQGSAGTSMRQLALACGLQVAAIYHYFPSKDALLGAVIAERRYSSRMSEEPMDIDASAPVERRLRDVFRVFWSGTLDEEPVLRLLLGEALRHEPAALTPGSALLEVFRSGVVTALEQHVPEIRDTGTVSELYIAQVFSAYIRHMFEPGTDPALIGEQHADVLVRAVLGSSA